MHYELIVSVSVVWLSEYPVAHEAPPRVYFVSLDEGEGVSDSGEGGVVRSKLVVEQEVVFDRIHKFFGSGSISSEGEGGDS